MKIETLALGPIGTNCFLLWEEGGDAAVLVDAAQGAWGAFQPILKEKGLRLEALLLTHGHWDHMGGAAEVQKETEAKVYAHGGDMIFYENPMVMSMAMPPGMTILPVKIDEVLEGGEELALLGKKFEVRHVPGHAPGNVVYYVGSEGVAFVGDVIFAGGIGRYDLPGGDFEVLEKSIQEKVYTLPDETVLYPGHGPATTVGEEKVNNPYVKALR